MFKKEINLNENTTILWPTKNLNKNAYFLNYIDNKYQREKIEEIIKVTWKFKTSEWMFYSVPVSRKNSNTIELKIKWILQKNGIKEFEIIKRGILEQINEVEEKFTRLELEKYKEAIGINEIEISINKSDFKNVLINLSWLFWNCYYWSTFYFTVWLQLCEIRMRIK